MNTAKDLKSQIDLAQSKGEPVPDGVMQQLLQGGIGLVIKLLLLLFDSKNRWKKIVQEVKAAYDAVKAEFETLKAQVEQLLAEIAALKEAKATGSNDALLARLAELETRQTKVDEALEETKASVAKFIEGAQEQLDALPEKVSAEIKEQAESLTVKIDELQTAIDKKQDKKK